jgi:RDD family
MKRRFVPDDEASANPPAQLVDPEAYDASEQQFAASLDSAAVSSASDASAYLTSANSTSAERAQSPARPPRFVPEEEDTPPLSSEIPGPSAEAGATDGAEPGIEPNKIAQEEGTQGKIEQEKLEENKVEASKVEESNSSRVRSENKIKEARTSEPAIPEQELLPGHTDLGGWHQEVAARLDSYQSRHGAQEPRYPSLRLKFESEPAGKNSSAPEISPQAAFPAEVTHSGSAAGAKRAPEPAPAARAEPSEAPPRVIHFPRQSVAPPSRLEELAEPVFDLPRILEAPEVAPVPPALGGMLIETVEEPRRERRPGFEIPLSPASMRTRMFAAGLDLVLVSFAVALFGYIFFSMVDVTVSHLETAAAWLAFGIIFWAGYQYLMLVFTGATPGLKLAGLQLTRFDDTPASQRSRRWRALASMLSVLSMGLGYAWCFLDEDQLCWHDRITGTYLSPHPSQPAQPVC